MTVEEKFKNSCLSYMRNKYFKLMSLNDVNNIDTAFSWCKYNFLHLYLIFVPSKLGDQFIFFACNSKVNRDLFTIKDITNKKGSVNLIAESLSIDSIKQLIARKIIKKPQNILKFSIEKSKLLFKTDILSGVHNYKLNNRIKSFLQDRTTNIFFSELKNVDTKYKQINNINLYLNSNKFFEREFHFKNIINDIHSAQFIDELSECLFAYNKGKWYICSTGIGSILEELMYKIVSLNKEYYKNEFSDNNMPRDNYKKNIFKSTRKSYHKIIHNGHPTAIDYKRIFQAKPISATDRSMRLIKALFIIRNSVDHYNSGFTNRNVCDLLLHGLDDIFNDYYIKMEKFQVNYTNYINK